MKALFNRVTENDNFIYLNGGPEESSHVIEDVTEDDTKALEYSDELSAKEINRMIKTVADKVESFSTEDRDKLFQTILDLSTAAAIENKSLITLLNTEITDELNSVLAEKGSKENVSFQFKQESWTSREADETEVPLITLEEVQPFEGGKPDALQAKISSVISDGERNFTGYIDPKLGPVNARGEKIPGMEGINLKDTLVADLANGGAEKKLSSSEDFQKAILLYNPSSKITKAEVDLIWDTMNGAKGTAVFDEKSVGELQKALSNVSELFKNAIGGVDLMYGPNTRESFRKVGALVGEVAQNYVDKPKYNVTFDIETVEDNNERKEIYQKYDEVAIVADHSGSMDDDIANLAKLVEATNYKRTDGMRTAFSFSSFERTADLHEAISDDLEAQKRVSEAMKDMKTVGGREYGLDAAIKMLNTEGVFSDNETVTRMEKDKDGNDVEVTRTPRRLMEIVTDESLQGISRGELAIAKQLCEQKGVDLIFVFSMDGNGSKTERVPLAVVEEMMLHDDSPFQQDFESRMDDSETFVNRETEQMEKKQRQIDNISWEGSAGDISQMNSYQEDVSLNNDKRLYELKNKAFKEVEGQMAQISWDGGVDNINGLTSNDSDLELKRLRNKYDVIQASFDKAENELADLDEKIQVETNPKQKEDLIQERGSLILRQMEMNDKDKKDWHENADKWATMSLREIEQQPGIESKRGAKVKEMKEHLVKKKVSLLLSQFSLGTKEWEKLMKDPEKLKEVSLVDMENSPKYKSKREAIVDKMKDYLIKKRARLLLSELSMDIDDKLKMLKHPENFMNLSFEDLKNNPALRTNLEVKESNLGGTKEKIQRGEDRRLGSIETSQRNFSIGDVLAHHEVWAQNQELKKQMADQGVSLAEKKEVEEN